MASEKTAPPAYDGTVLTLANHPLKPTVRAVKRSDLPILLGYLGTTNPTLFEGTSLIALEVALDDINEQGLPYLLLSIPLPLDKNANLPAEVSQYTEQEAKAGQKYVGVVQTTTWEPSNPQPEWRKTLSINVNMPDWADKHGLTRLLIDAVVEQLSRQYDTPKGKALSTGSLVSRIFGQEKQPMQLPTGDQKKYKNLIMVVNMLKTSVRDEDGNPTKEYVAAKDRYKKWGFEDAGRLKGVIESQGEEWDIYYYQRKI